MTLYVSACCFDILEMSIFEQASHAEQKTCIGNTEDGAIDLAEEADITIKQEHEVIDLTANDSDERATPKRKHDDDSSAEEDEIKNDDDKEEMLSTEDPLSAPIQESGEATSMTQSNEKSSNPATAKSSGNKTPKLKRKGSKKKKKGEVETEQENRTDTPTATAEKQHKMKTRQDTAAQVALLHFLPYTYSTTGNRSFIAKWFLQANSGEKEYRKLKEAEEFHAGKTKKNK